MAAVRTKLQEYLWRCFPCCNGDVFAIGKLKPKFQVYVFPFLIIIRLNGSPVGSFVAN